MVIRLLWGERGNLAMSRLLRSGAESPWISICIPTYRAPNENLDRLLRSLSVHTSIPYETVVLDCEGELRGYTVPQNEAVAAAKAKIIVAANDDVVVFNRWYAPLVSALLDGAACATPNMDHHDGPQVYAPYFMAWWIDAWNSLGGLDEQFTFWCSDIDLARRLVDSGELPARPYLNPPIVHNPGGTSRLEPEQHRAISDKTWEDLCNYQRKWGVSAEVDKGRLQQYALGNTGWPPDVESVDS